MKKGLFFPLFIFAISLIAYPFVAFGAAGFSISPSKIDLDLKQGDEVAQKINIRNSSDGDFNFTVFLQDYTVKEDNSFEYYDVGTQANSAKDLITFDSTPFTLKKDEVKGFDLKISIPKDESLGARSSILIFRGEPVNVSNENYMLKGVPQAGVRIDLALLDKDGNGINRAGEVRAFTASVEGNSLRQLQTKPKVSAEAIFANIGNAYLNIIGDVTFSCATGKKIVEQKIDLPEFTVLANTQRKVDVAWENPPIVGFCTAKLDLAYQPNDWIIKSADFMIYNLSLVLMGAGVIAFFIILIIAIIIHKKRKIKKYIKKYKKTTKDEDILGDVFGWKEISKKSGKGDCLAFFLILLIALAFIGGVFANEIKQLYDSYFTQQENQVQVEQPIKTDQGIKNQESGITNQESNTETATKDNAISNSTTSPDATKTPDATTTTGTATTPATNTEDKTTTPAGPIVCSQIAKLCPDGSYVARTGPNCEFAACPTAKPTMTPTTITTQDYTVKSGDTLSGIANSSDMTTAELIKLNPDLKNPDSLQIGQKIKIPSK